MRTTPSSIFSSLSIDMAAAFLWSDFKFLCAKMVVEIYEETAQLGLTLKMPLAHGILEVSQNKQHIFRLETNIWFPQV